MSWFENQIEERRNADQQLLEDSFVKIAGVVLGQRSAEKISDRRIITKNAIDEILKYYHCKPAEFPETVRDAEAQLDYALRLHGLMRRGVTLKEKWYRDAFGPILAFTDQGDTPVALLPGTFGGYFFTDPETGQQKRVNAKTAARFDTEAICFYQPLPQKKLGISDLLLYMKRCVSLNDMLLLIAITLAVTLVGLALPRITKALTGPVMAAGRESALIGVAISVFCVCLSSQLFSSAKGLIQSRLSTKTSMGVQASMMMRLLSLPASFFRSFSPGELKSRAMSVNQLCSLLLGIVMTTSLTSVSSLLYITQIFRYARALVIPSVLILLATVCLSVITTFVQLRIQKKHLEHSAKEEGMSYSMISGIQKIKLAGAEKRVFAKWLGVYAEGAELVYNPPLFLKINGVITTAIGLLSNILLYFLAVRAEVTPSSWFAFTAAYGMVLGAFTSLAGTAQSAAQIKPILEMAEPVLKTAPEISEGKQIVTDLSGSVELDRVSFRYGSGSPCVLDDLSLKIRPGEYVAIVGRTGCGKSTLVRLLLGFEAPRKGAILYDGKRIDSFDLPSLRKKIGTVMQDAGLFQGDIYTNILISAPELGLDDAWAAAETAGIADDIRSMPMGMHTIVSEGQGGISGGQRQRIMIARAIAPKPKLLILDEATSSLDNKTQKQVSDALEQMGCTRIVIAHRLSTIRRCDRILVLDGGRIVEEGSYDQLIRKGGFFAELVERQQLS